MKTSLQKVIHRSLLPIIGVFVFLVWCSTPRVTLAYTISNTGGTIIPANPGIGLPLSIAIPCSLIQEPPSTNRYITAISSSTSQFTLYLSDGPMTPPCASAFPYGGVNYAISSLSGYPPGTYYYFVGLVNTLDDPTFAFVNYSYMRFHWDGVTVDDLDFPSNFDRFITLEPGNMQTVGTTTYQFHAASFYISSSTDTSDYFMRFKWKRNQDDQAAVALIAAQGGNWITYDFDPNDWGVDPGYNIIATNTLFAVEGQYTFVAEVRRSSWVNTALGWVGLDSLYDGGLIMSSSTQFIAGYQTAYDQFIASTTQSSSEFFASSTITLADAKKYCSLSLDFSISDCFGVVFGWQSGPMATAFNNIKNGFFSYVPFGYVTRFVTVITDTSTTTLPSLTYTFPASAPGFMANADFTFNPWQYFYTDGSPVKDEIVANDGSGKNIWEIFEPIINIIVYITLLFMIIRDLTGIDRATHPREKQSTLTKEHI